MGKDKTGKSSAKQTGRQLDKQKVDKKDVAKAYEKYSEQFTPKPNYLGNTVKAFLSGGAICAASAVATARLEAAGLSQRDAASYVTIALICLAQLLTGLGVFDSLAKICGAGVIVPITGFANSMVAPAIEYKKEGIVLGVGAKLFSIAGPVLVCGIASSVVVGIIYWIIGLF